MCFTSKKTYSQTPTKLTPNRIVLKTSLTPPASGSAFYELTPPSTLKLTTSVYGPRPLPPSAGFSPTARVTAELKFAPFSTRGERRGYVRDGLERELSLQLQIAISGMVRASAYPKSGIDVFVTVLDCEGRIEEMIGVDAAEGEGERASLGAMQVLTGAITCASTAIADAGIECVDLVAAGMAALVEAKDGKDMVVMDPSPLDGWQVRAAVLVGYMAARDEITLVWSRGEVGVEEFTGVMESAVEVATKVRGVVNDAVRERLVALLKARGKKEGKKAITEDVEMTG